MVCLLAATFSASATAASSTTVAESYRSHTSLISTSASAFSQVGSIVLLGTAADQTSVSHGYDDPAHLARTNTSPATGFFAPQTTLSRLPGYAGRKTQGILQMGSKEVDLISGYAGPASQISKGTPGFNNLVRSHVEGHAAALMRMEGASQASLFINRIPCAGPTGCNAMLPRMLPEVHV